ncbi:MAG: hypothetical protein ABR499_08250 [Gemmatimonadaceae bacterium]
MTAEDRRPPDRIDAPRDADDSAGGNPAAYFALEFKDGIAAADFAAALVNFLGSSEGESYSAGPGGVEVWISSPLTRGGEGMHCCIYTNESAVRAAQAAGLGIRRAERVDPADLPRRRVLIIGNTPADAPE